MHDAYYMVTNNQDEAVELLRRTGLHGFVFPTDGTWTGLMVEGPPLNVNKRLVFCNTSTLVRLVQSGNVSWWCDVFKGQERVSSDIGSATKGFTVADELDIPAIANLLQIDADSLEQLHSVFSPDAIYAERIEDKPWERLATLLHLDLVREAGYYEFAEIYDEDDPDFAGVVEVCPKREEVDLRSRIEFLSNDKRLWLPRALHGDNASTRRAMKKILRKAWKADGWSEVISELEMVPFADFPDEIHLEVDRYFLPPAKKVWRLYPFDRELRNVAHDLEPESKLRRTDKSHALAMKGMEHFWFALTFLSQEEHYSFDFDGKDITLKSAYRSFLEGHVQWLPEIVAIEPFLRSVSSFHMPHEFMRVWGHNVISEAITCGWDFSVDRYQGEFMGDLVAYMIADGIIRPHGERYRVCDF